MEPEIPERASGGGAQNVVSYPRSYFERFQPLTALDMVRQVPGFQLENNTAARGYNDALGNLLINDRRPTAKQDQPLDILSRIPASLVERIELIKGRVRDIDLQGQANLINVLLSGDAGAAVQWDGYLKKSFDHGGVAPKASISLSRGWQGIDFNLGLGFRRSYVGRDGTEIILDGDRTLAERRVTGHDNRNTFITGNLSASSWLGETLVHLNTNINLVERLRAQFSRRMPREGVSYEQLIDRDSDEPVFETGLDIERSLRPDLSGKLIFLFIRGVTDTLETQRDVEATQERLLLRVADTDNVATEGIARLELDWTATPGHTVQANLEGVYNVLDGRYRQTDDRGADPIVVDVPGANSRVEETRGDFLLKDTWSPGGVDLEYGMGAEVSTISQSGDVEQARQFFFLKPQALMSYSPGRAAQTRLRLAREVAQLNLNDFISAAVLEDDDLALGNPDLKPGTTWVSELSHERRYGRDGALKLTVFHHWISDVLDLLPLTNDFEVPGNIGDGRRWGIEVEATVPLRWMGLSGARLKTKAHWQNSTVVDPVTGKDRVLSAIGTDGDSGFFNVENRYAYSIDFRQDFEAARTAWGFFMQERAEQPRFKVNELEINDEDVELNAYIETTRWLGIKIRVDFENILDIEDYRERTVFTGRRDLSPSRSLEVRDQIRGEQLYLTFSGTY